MVAQLCQPSQLLRCQSRSKFRLAQSVSALRSADSSSIDPGAGKRIQELLLKLWTVRWHLGWLEG
ncbi:hypothetical protein ES332_D13G134400v1 [Gossypium tomentosum]|uniref:Uncharacterized protein n=2 Tax=Gossypium TaxID=3633 RepID=A0A5D2HYC4_GOSTO|nr:hypothetical protein ES332_D13G134400v1 [Gossypium tomentosum]